MRATMSSDHRSIGIGKDSNTIPWQEHEKPFFIIID